MIQQVRRRNGSYFSSGGNFSLHPSFFHPGHPIQWRVRPQAYCFFKTPIALSNIFDSKFEFDKVFMNFQIIWQESLFFRIEFVRNIEWNMPVSVCRTLGESRGAVSGRDGISGWLFLRGLIGGWQEREVLLWRAKRWKGSHSNLERGQVNKSLCGSYPQRNRWIFNFLLPIQILKSTQDEGNRPHAGWPVRQPDRS